MKKTALLNAPLSAAVARLGHTDGLVVCDAGLPIPAGPERIDLAVTPGLPGFLAVLKAALTEMQVERAVIATEMASISPALETELRALLAEVAAVQGKPVAVETVPHTDFKRLSASTRAIVRTGECTPYANVILYSGVPF
jgi:D-ribose pyranase